MPIFSVPIFSVPTFFVPIFPTTTVSRGTAGQPAAAATMTARLTLGYRDAVALSPSPLHPAGARVTGHEFHRCAVTPRAGAPAWAWRGAEPEGFVHRGVHASFLHTHPAGQPEAVARLVAAAG